MTFKENRQKRTKNKSVRPTQELFAQLNVVIIHFVF